MWINQRRWKVHFNFEFAKLRTLRALKLTCLTRHWYALSAPVRLNTHHKAPYANFFVLCCVVSIVRYGLTPKNLGKAIRRHFIPLKVIKYASNVIDSYLYNIIIKDLDKEKQVLRRVKNNISKSHFQEKWKKQDP